LFQAFSRLGGRSRGQGNPFDGRTGRLIPRRRDPSHKGTGPRGTDGLELLVALGVTDGSLSAPCANGATPLTKSQASAKEAPRISKLFGISYHQR
jgi:hypothetical protein